MSDCKDGRPKSKCYRSHDKCDKPSWKSKEGSPREEPPESGKQTPPERQRSSRRKEPGFDNSAQAAVWAGFEDLITLETDQFGLRLHDTATARKVEALLKERNGPGTCAYVATLAHCRREHQVDLHRALFRKWGPLPAESVDNWLALVSRKFEVTVRVMRVREREPGVLHISDHSVVTSVRPKGRWDLLEVPTKQDGVDVFHFLPVSNAADDVLVVLPDRVAQPVVAPPAQMVIETAQSSTPAVPQVPAVAETTLGAEDVRTELPTQPECVAAFTTEFPCLRILGRTLPISSKLPNTELLVQTALWSEDATRDLSDLVTTYCSDTDSVVVNRGEPGDNPAPLGAWDPDPLETLRYEGIWEPPPGRFDWRGGWWPQTRPRWKEETSTWRRDAQVCAATLESASLFRDSVLYLPLQDPVSLCRRGISVVGERTLTTGAGGRLTQFFRAGDVVRLDDREFSVGADYTLGMPLLRLIDAASEAGPFEKMGKDIAAAARNVFSCRLFGRLEPHLCSVIPGTVVQWDEEVRQRVDWATVVATAPSEYAGPLDVCRKVAAADKWVESRVPAFETARRVKVQIDAAATAPYSYLGGTLARKGSHFPWGDCYSCGGLLPMGRRLPGRLCGCENRTPAARTALTGQHVATIGQVVYPGVVQTTSHHPPIKDGKRTIATESVFQDAPFNRTLGPQSLSATSVVRGWVALG